MSTTLTALFGEHPDVRLVEFLAANRDFDYNVSDLARKAAISRPAAYKVLHRLRRQGVVRRTRKVGNSWFFGLNDQSPLVKPLLELEVRLGEAVPTRRRRRAAVSR